VARPQTLDQLTAGLRAAPIDYFKISTAGRSAGTYFDFFQAAGFPAAISVPTLAGVQCNSTTVGALPFTNPPVGEECWLSNLQGMASVLSGLILVDRLVHYGGGNGTQLTNTFGALALPRYATGEQVVAFLEWYSATGAGTFTVNFTDADNQPRSSVVNVSTAPVAGQIIPVPMPAGSRGVKSVQSVTLAASTGAIGSFGVTLVRRIARFGGKANEGFELDWVDLGLPQILNNACLGIFGLMSGTSSGSLDLGFIFADV
jgi:hypothetical protein